MRVISGKSRGTKLSAPEGMHTRPTIDRIKETLFNMIAFDLPGCHFLDLFSGSGGIGIESLSRGAKEAVFIDNNQVALKCIQDNLEKTNLTPSARVYNMDVLTGLTKLHQQEESFDIIFMDPPYQLENIQQILEYIGKYELLKTDGYLILERATNYQIESVEGLQLTKEKKYKTTTLSFFERTDNQ